MTKPEITGAADKSLSVKRKFDALCPDLFTLPDYQHNITSLFKTASPPQPEPYSVILRRQLRPLLEHLAEGRYLCCIAVALDDVFQRQLRRFQQCFCALDAQLLCGQARVYPATRAGFLMERDFTHMINAAPFDEERQAVASAW